MIYNIGFLQYSIFVFIFQEMIVPTTPLAAMAATPRIDLDNKYQFNPARDPVLAKVNFYFLFKFLMQ